MTDHPMMCAPTLHDSQPQTTTQKHSSSQLGPRSTCASVADARGRCDSQVTVVISCFFPLLARGLFEVLLDDSAVRILRTDLLVSQLGRTLVDLAPRVAILGGNPSASFVARLARLQSTTDLVVLARAPSRAYALQVLVAGATCLPDAATPDELRAAIHCAAMGDRICRSSDRFELRRSYPIEAQSLTARELQVLKHMVSGHTYVRAAAELEISVTTVRTHAIRVREKLGVRTKHDLLGMPIPQGAKP